MIEIDLKMTQKAVLYESHNYYLESFNLAHFMNSKKWNVVTKFLTWKRKKEIIFFGKILGISIFHFSSFFISYFEYSCTTWNQKSIDLVDITYIECLKKKFCVSIEILLFKENFRKFLQFNTKFLIIKH